MNFNPIIDLVIILGQIIFLEGVLSLDNAAVLGAVVLHLPDDQLVPWPRFLARPGHGLDRVLGPQRTAALRVGLLGAYLGRGLMLAVASLVIQNEWLQFVGALYLIKVSSQELSLFRRNDAKGVNEEREEHPGNIHGMSFWNVVLTVELMDLAFSLDNVVVVINLSNQLWLVMLGVAAGIITMRFAAGLFSKLIEKIPALNPAAYVLVFVIGVELILERLLGVEISNPIRFGGNIGILLVAVLLSKVPLLSRMMQLPIRFCLGLLGWIDRLFFVFFFPFGWGARVLRRKFLPDARQTHASPHIGH
jgi:tellurite resistance protein TerC